MFFYCSILKAKKERLKTTNESFTLEAYNETLPDSKIASHKTKNTATDKITRPKT